MRALENFGNNSLAWALKFDIDVLSPVGQGDPSDIRAESLSEDAIKAAWGAFREVIDLAATVFRSRAQEGRKESGCC